MRNSYLSKANSMLEKLNIKVKDINSKSDIQKSKNFNATLTPSLNKIIIE